MRTWVFQMSMRIRSNIDTISLKLLMKNILLRQMHVSDSIKITGMDFLQVFHDYINFEPENSSMWTMHKDVDKGISYTKFNVRRSAPQVADLSVFELTGFERAFLAKLRFSKLVLDKIANATDTGIIFKPEYTFESLFNS